MFFRLPDDTDGPDLEDLVDADPDAEERDEQAVLCAECGQEVTSHDHKAAVDGGFEHSFANPAGIVYHIGCFEEARGVGGIGDETSEFTWFEGYTWQVVVCHDCTTHLGWRYWSSDHTFYGLILDRLENI